MRIVIDIEANRLVDPDKIWVIVCKDIDTGEYHVFRRPTEVDEVRQQFRDFAGRCTLWIGHNLCGYDLPVVSHLLGIPLPSNDKLCDTLIVSKLADYSRVKHSVENFGEEFGLEKGKFHDWSRYSEEMETYCKRDVDITELIYRKYLRYIDNSKHRMAIELEHQFQSICNRLHNSGFAFNKVAAEKLLHKIELELAILDKDILESFPPRLKLIREVHPKVTKHGTLSKTDFRWTDDLSDYNGGAFCRCRWEPFNPSSHKQIVAAMHGAGWAPTAKTKAFIETERTLKRSKDKQEQKDLKEKLDILKITGYKINEENLMTLPPKAPASARTLAKRILLESRRRTLTEWLALCVPSGPKDCRIHGRFYGIGAWTHRMAHQEPNTANIPNEFDLSLRTKLYGKELRQLWIAPKGRLLVGVDAEGIQLRIFAHYINDPEFTEALVKGRKDDKSDPHSLNQRILGPVCKSRAAAKRFIFALLLGGGIGKLAEILEAGKNEAETALERLIHRYEGFARLKETTIPRDARRGWFDGLDGRSVRIPSDTEGGRKHLAMSGYLQNGEAVIIKTAAVIAEPQLAPLDSFFVDIIHDEFQTESPNNMTIALQVSGIIKDAIKKAGEVLKLRCPLAGSDWNDDHKDYTIGPNWYVTH